MKKIRGTSSSSRRAGLRLRHFLPIAALLLVLVAAACSGSGTNETGGAEVELPTSAPTAVVEEVPTEAAPTEAVEPTAAPTEVPPTAAPEPTDEPAPTAEPAEAGLAGGDCFNPFYPVVEGRTYRYRSDAGGMGEVEYTMTYSDVSDESFTVTLDAGSDSPVVYSWTCTADGLLSPTYAQLPIEGFEIEVVEADGLTVPSADDFTVGNSWTTHYVVKATLPDTGAGSMVMTQTMDMTNEVVAVEAVSVPAGDYPDAVRVDTTGTINVKMTAGDIEVPATAFDMTYATWYAEDVGMVRQEFIGGFFGSEGAGGVTELVAIE